jgi:hypothetical protein
MPQYKPIGGDGDGVMARKVEQVWQPLLDRFLKEKEKLMAREVTTSTGLLMKTDFNVKTFKKKYDLLRDRYVALKRECKVDRHQLRGETGAAAGDQPSTAQAGIAVGMATAKWPLFLSGMLLLGACSAGLQVRNSSCVLSMWRILGRTYKWLSISQLLW